ncbi:hypothetical protein PV04_09732 [Phialophora macrospora]|uniref:Major facilitator superfamily (MFS) profile domain-containing protein n=1 Tax=Phialophora macrospora TaxID=1851006 RepID=A0A0D2FD53_9EURO|nr:hypothetical protein PV04_09732 [Phialophora macrospora]
MGIQTDFEKCPADAGDSNSSEPTKDLAHTDQVDRYGITLSPTPTTDPLDPLNWSKWRKAVVVFIACFSSFLSVYMTGAPIPSFFMLMDQFDATYSEVNWTVAIPSLGLGIGPLLCDSYADIYGRRLVFALSTMLTILATGCTTIKSISYGGYMFCRFLQGFGAGPSIIGLAVISDISWEHERGLRTGLWILAVGIGGVLGSLFGGVFATINQWWPQYHVIILYGVLLLLILFALPETLYPREAVVASEREHGRLPDFKRTKQIKFWHPIKIPGINHPKPWESMVRFIKTFAYPRIVFSLLPYIFLQYWCVVGFLTMLPAVYFDKKLQIQGALYLGLVVGTVFAEIFCSGKLSDWISGQMAKRNNNKRTPEMRLWLGYPGAILGTIGLVVWGLMVDRHWHWMVGQVAFFLFSAGMQMGNTAVTSYIFDCYGEHPIELMTFYAAVINASAFAEPWFINYWVEDVGFTWCFATQGLMCLALIPIYAALQIWGNKLARPMKFD